MTTDTEDGLKAVYERCDVSNNGTIATINFEEFKKYIQADYLPIQAVQKAIAEAEQQYDYEDGVEIAQDISKTIRQKLGIEKEK